MFDINSKNWHRWLWESSFFYLLLKKSVTTHYFKLSIHSRSNKLSMSSTRGRISSPRVLNMERPCSVSNVSSTSLVERRVGGVRSSSSWSSSLSSSYPLITSAMISPSLEKEPDVTISLSRSANDSPERFGWMTSLSNSCNCQKSSANFWMDHNHRSLLPLSLIDLC